MVQKLAAPHRFLLTGQITNAFEVNSWAKRKAKKTHPFPFLSPSLEGASACNPSHAPCTSALRPAVSLWGGYLERRALL